MSQPVYIRGTWPNMPNESTGQPFTKILHPDAWLDSETTDTELAEAINGLLADGRPRRIGTDPRFYIVLTIEPPEGISR